jgi:hypothetical protein
LKTKQIRKLVFALSIAALTWGAIFGTTTAKASAATTKIPTYHPSLPSFSKGKPTHIVKVTSTLYEDIVDIDPYGVKRGSYIQFDHFYKKLNKWKSVWSGYALKAKDMPIAPDWYLNSLSIITQKDGSKFVSPSFLSTGDGTGNTADVFYVSPSETYVRQITAIGGLDPSIAPIDGVRAKVLKTSKGTGAIEFTGYSGSVLSYNAAKSQVKQTTISNPTSLLGLEADGKPYVMVNAHQTSASRGTLSFSAKNGATYHVGGSSSKPTLTIPSRVEVGFNLGLNQNVLLYSDFGSNSLPCDCDAGMLHDLLIPKAFNGRSSFNIGIQNEYDNNLSVNNGFFTELHVTYSH